MYLSKSKCLPFYGALSAQERREMVLSTWRPKAAETNGRRTWCTRRKSIKREFYCGPKILLNNGRMVVEEQRKRGDQVIITRSSSQQAEPTVNL